MIQVNRVNSPFFSMKNYLVNTEKLKNAIRFCTMTISFVLQQQSAHMSAASLTCVFATDAD